MSGHDEEVLGKLSEELADALFANEHIDPAAWAQRFGVDVAAVQHCQRALQALAMSLGEEVAEGHPELPQPQLPQDFEVRGELGRGGMGVVYRARQRSLDRDVAIKVLRPGDLVFGDALRRFRSEARSLARLRHRHIVSIYDSGETPEGLLWFAMDLVDGQTLAEELRQRGRMLPARATKIIRQITSAIAHAHAQGIVHRDLKPQNVLIDGQGDAFVVDFGLARDASAANARTMSGELLGTPAYMSPEQARGDSSRIGEASDVWALGALLYEMLVGKGPYSGKPLHETIRAILEDEPKPMRRGDKRVPEALEHICLHALQKRPEDRYAGAIAFGEDLERFQDGRGITAQKPSKLRRVTRALQSHWRAIATAAAAVLVTATALAAWLPKVRRDAVVAEAQRLIATGHPDAAIDSFRSILVDTPSNSLGHEELQYDFVRALNDRAGELLLANDPTGAMLLTSEAREIAARRSHQDGWRWEHVRASVFDDAADTLVPDIAQPLIRDLRSGLAGRVAMARAAASMGWVDVSMLADSLRLPVLADAVRAQARRLQEKGADARWSFPFTWSGPSIDAWWSESVEDLLANLATAPQESPTARAVAFRAWSILVGLPTFENLQDPRADSSSSPTAEEVAKAAPIATAAWRKWRSMPRQDACRARLDFLVLAMQRPDEVLPGARQLLTEARKWTGYAGPDDQASFVAWWQMARQRPFEQVLRAGLGISNEATFAASEALDRSATAEPKSARLWRQLAWLRVPDGVRIPECLPKNTKNGHVWRTACLEALHQSDARPLTARSVLLRFDDGSDQPEVVVQTRQVVHIGDEVAMRLDATPAQPSWFSLRDIWEDDSMRQCQPILAQRPGSQVRPPQIGEVSVSLHGRVLIDSAGAHLDGLSSSAIEQSLPFCETSKWHDGVKRVWLDHAAGISGTTVTWDMGQRVTSFLLVVGIEEGTIGEARDLSWWHDAIAKTFVTASSAANTAQQRDSSADWLTASFWPMPQAQAAMDTLLDASPKRTDQAIRMAAMLANGHPEYLTQAALLGAGPVAAATVRLATSSNDAAVREQALAALERMPETFWTPRIAATLRAAAANGSVALPPILSQTIDSLPTPGGWWEWLTRADVWQGLLLVLVITFLAKRWLHYPNDRARTIVASVGYAAFWLLFVRLKLGGVILTPSFVPLLVMLACLTWASRGHRGWRIAGIVVIGLFTLWSVCSWCFGLDAPPRSTPGMLLIAGMMVLGTPSSRRAHRASLAKHAAPSPRLRRKQRLALRWTIGLLATLFLALMGLEVVSARMSRDLLDTAKVQIVDADGKPAPGVQTMVEWSQPRPYFQGHRLPVSDAQGYVDLSSLKGKVATFAQFAIHPRLPGFDGQPQPITENTTIRVPNVGRLEVQLLDADGQPWRDSSNAHQRVYPQSQSHLSQSFDANGRAVFPAVACGQLVLAGNLQNTNILNLGEVDGPSQSGEVRVIEVRIPRDLPYVVGLVQGVDGRPLQGELTLGFESTTVGFRTRITSDEQGRFRYLFANDPSGGTLTIGKTFLRDSKVKVPASQSLEHDIGTVTLRSR